MTDEWVAYGVCRKPENHPDDWDMAAGKAEKLRAVEKCLSCPVIAQCLVDAQRRPPYELIQAGFGWRYPSLEPVDAVSGRRLKMVERPKAFKHGVGAYARGLCKCGVCKGSRDSYKESRKPA